MNEVPIVVQGILARIEQQIRALSDRVTQLEAGNSPTFRRILDTLERIEMNQTDEKTALARLTTDMQTMRDKQDENKTILVAFIGAQSDANTRLLATIEELRNQAGSGNADAINALADKAETIATDQQAAVDVMKAGILSETAIDQPAPVVSPATVTVTQGAQQQFSCNVDVNWAADNGNIDATGLYTAPTNGSTSDVVTATAKADGQKATASVVVV